MKEGEPGRKVADVCRTYEITDQTYYRCKRGLILAAIALSLPFIALAPVPGREI